MNIFQAFEQGGGRATFEGYTKYAIRDLTRFIWQSENNLSGDFVSEGDLRCNDWIPYVPRGTCSSCGQAIPSPKTKRTEVFKNVSIFKTDSIGTKLYVPNFSEYGDFDRFKSLCEKPSITMTLEWEE